MRKIRGRTKVLIFVIAYICIAGYLIYPTRLDEKVQLSSEDIAIKVVHDNWDSGLVYRVEEGEDLLKESIRDKYINISTKYVELKGVNTYKINADPSGIGYFMTYGKVIGTTTYEGKRVPVFEAKYTDLTSSRILREDFKPKILLVFFLFISPLVLIIMIILIILYLKDFINIIRNKKLKKE
ncbi:hypothetical protein [Clostridium sp. LP20]|uniref:hypothetical protein n=1 Tax=Clostridium sp. LP20 TaxID=3418665 RepID=UPI003EE4B15C